MPSLTISYATRLNAEQAMQRGRLYQEKRLQVTWAVPAPVKLDVSNISLFSAKWL